MMNKFGTVPHSAPAHRIAITLLHTLCHSLCSTWQVCLNFALLGLGTPDYIPNSIEHELKIRTNLDERRDKHENNCNIIIFSNYIFVYKY